MYQIFCFFVSVYCLVLCLRLLHAVKNILKHRSDFKSMISKTGWRPWRCFSLRFLFLGIITREQAEKLLRGQRVGSFLVRVSERVWGYVMSYLGTHSDGVHGQVVPQVKHFLIDAGTQGYRFFGANRMTHPSLADLVRHHMVCCDLCLFISSLRIDSIVM